MSKQMTIKMMGKTVEVKTNSEVAIKRALCKVMRMNNLTFGNILTVKIVDDQVQFTYQSKKATWNTWVPTCNSIAEIVAEVEAPVVAEVEVEAPATYTWDDTPPSAKEIAWERLCRLRDISDALHVRIVALDIRTDDYFDKVIHLGNRALRISQEGARIEREYGFTIR